MERQSMLWRYRDVSVFFWFQGYSKDRRGTSRLKCLCFSHPEETKYCHGAQMPQEVERWITVANRLPFVLSSDGRDVSTASGGLVAALNGVKSACEKIWIGCAPEGLTAEKWPELEKSLPSGPQNWKYEPIFTNRVLYDSYYNGACNDVLWPLLHYQSELVAFNDSSWQAYL
jgi:trehalose-6-phosphate synthase